ncbi:MAG TPA: hypothetical protein VN763_15820, partial [Saprospiraceae bacterium]|nr:hypothetical protein [Saprospiraceae bacterium]
MKFIRSFIIFFAIFFTCVDIAFAQASSSRFSSNVYVNIKGDSLWYRLLFPDSDTLRKYPLVIFLHGSGERGNDNEAQL